MYIIWKDPNMKLHGKRHKRDSYYFRVHYGKQRLVYITKEYVDKPTEAQKNAREAFTELRREVARQLRDERLRAEWVRRFEADNEGYKMLHTYVYAMMKRGESVIQEMSLNKSLMETQQAASLHIDKQPILMLWNGTMVPLFLPNEVPKQVM